MFDNHKQTSTDMTFNQPHLKYMFFVHVYISQNVQINLFNAHNNLIHIFELCFLDEFSLPSSLGFQIVHWIFMAQEEKKSKFFIFYLRLFSLTYSFSLSLTHSFSVFSRRNKNFNSN